MSAIDTITMVANLSLALSFVVGLIFGVTQVLAAARDRKERFTLEALRNFQSKEFSELIYYVIRNNPPQTYDEFQKLSEKDQIEFLQYAQQMESLGILVSLHYINLDLIDITLGSLVTTSWEKYRPVIMDMREKQPDPFLAEYYQWLAESVSERMKKNPRKPFYLSPSQK
jgi:hypothetical protein